MHFVFFSSSSSSSSQSHCYGGKLRTTLTLAHILSDNINGFFRHHSVELHQLLVSQFLHDLSLLQEGFRRHGARFQRLDGHSRRPVPRA